MTTDAIEGESLRDDFELKARILLADDHPMLREGIRRLLERQPGFEVVGEASNGEEAIVLTRELVPDIVIMDIHMPKVSGLEATKQIKAEYPTVGVLVLTVHDEDEYILGLLQAGAAGYLVKTVYGEELVQAIRSIKSGEFVLHPVAAQRLLAAAANLALDPVRINDVTELTERELQVLKLAARGMSNKEIAIDLDIGIRTVKGHLVNIFGKMRVGSRTEAVLVALKKGWVTLSDED